MSDLRSAAPFRPGAVPSFAPKAHPPRAGLRSPGEPATALDDRKFDPEPEPDRGADRSGGPSAGPFRADGLYPAADPERLRSESDHSRVARLSATVRDRPSPSSMPTTTRTSGPTLLPLTREFGLPAPPSFTVDNLGTTTTDRGLGAGDVARRRVGPRRGSRSQYRSGRSFFGQPFRLVQCSQLRQISTGCQRGLDELGNARVLG